MELIAIVTDAYRGEARNGREYHVVELNGLRFYADADQYRAFEALVGERVRVKVRLSVDGRFQIAGVPALA